MFRLMGIFLIVAIAAAAYFLVVEDSSLLSSLQLPSKQEQRQDSIVIEQDQQQLPTTSVTSRSPVISTPDSPAPLAEFTEQEKVQAKVHVNSITAQAEKPLDITSADHFVTAEQILQLPALQEPQVVAINSADLSPALVVSAPARDTANLSEVDKNTENAAVAQSFAISIPSFKQQITERTAAPSKSSVEKIKITDSILSDTSEETDANQVPASVMMTIKKNFQALSDINISQLTSLVGLDKADQPQEPILSATAEKTALATAEQTANQIVAPDTIHTISNKNRITLRELLSQTQSDKKRIFYLHAVNAHDRQGIWGIIQHGLIGTFSKGITLTQADGKIKAIIPHDADEVLGTKRSSFLGKLLNNKVLTTYVYNYKQGNIGKNPDFIEPGQQLIIVTFTEEELMSVYRHFSQSIAQ